MSPQTLPSYQRRRELLSVAALFLKLGTIGFGGPAAHIALMQDEVVRRRRWLSQGDFLDLLGATNLIPGPNSTEMAIHIGHRRAGFPGLVVAGACFILPAVLIVLCCAWFYRRFGSVPEVEALLYGIKPVIIAVVFQALWSLGRAALKSWVLAILATAVAALNIVGLNELLLLAIAAIAGAVAGSFRRGSSGTRTVAAPVMPLKPALASIVPAGVSASIPFGLWPLFLFFLKVGSVLYGSGYVLLAFLRSDLVEKYGWLTETQLLDAVAVGQFTPGPVFTTATFIGYLLGGTSGALVATAGIFLPAFVFVAISGPLIPRIRQSRLAGAVLDAVNAASLALMAVVTLQLGRAALVDVVSILLCAGAVLLLFRFKLNSAWLVLIGAVAGLIHALLT